MNFKWIPASNNIKAKAISKRISAEIKKGVGSKPSMFNNIPRIIKSKTSGIRVDSKKEVNKWEIKIIRPIYRIISAGSIMLFVFTPFFE